MTTSEITKNLNINVVTDSAPAMNGAQYLLTALYKEGIEYFFMVPGKLINPIMSCYNLSTQEKIKPIVAAHEGGAAYMAEGYARASGKFGVCITIGGPGATNTVTAIASAYADNFPVLLISGQIPVAYEMMGTLQDSTQSGFNLTEVMKPITAVAYEIKEPILLDRYLKNVIKNMLSYETKPVYLSLSKDVLLGKIDSIYKKISDNLLRPKFLDLDSASKVNTYFFKKTTRICFLVGSRAKTTAISELLIKFAEKYRIPIATTLSAKGCFPEDHELSLGVFGYSGHKRAIDTILSDEVETLVLLGFDATQWNTLAWHEKIKPTVALIQVDKSNIAINRYLPIDYGVVGDEYEFLKYIYENGSFSLEFSKNIRNQWLETVLKIPKHYDIENYDSDIVPIHPARVMKELREYFPRNTMVFVDSGAHRSFAGHYWEAYSAMDYFSATTLGPMGWTIPASIGAKLARPDLPCLVITGDGCMLMHGIEIQTAERHHLPIVYVVINNSYYSASYFNNKNNIPELTNLPTHNWAAFAESLSVASCIVQTVAEIRPAIERAFLSGKTFLIDIRCGYEFSTPVPEYTKQLKKLGGV